MSKNSKKTKGDKANMTKKAKPKDKDLKVPSWYANMPSVGADIGRKKK